MIIQIWFSDEVPAMNVRKDNFVFDKHFPFSYSDGVMAAGFNMDRVYHWHECLEISYVKEGRGRYYIEDRICEMEPGDIIILNNIEPHYLEVYDRNMHQPVITFEPSLIWNSGSNTLDYDYLKPFFERGTNFNNKLNPGNPFTSEIRDHLRVIEKEFFERPVGYQQMIKARLLMILTYLVRYFRKEEKSEAGNGSKRQQLLRIEEILRYVSINFDRDIGLEEVASMLCVSPQYFSTFFRKVTGTTFIEYLNNIRVNNAIRLLSESDNKITHIAVECGFNNTSNFNAVFKKFTGKTPSEFRA
jgi:AraC-like DNA-binding protein